MSGRGVEKILFYKKICILSLLKKKLLGLFRLGLHFMDVFLQVGLF